jgi:cytidine kinase
MEPDYVVAGLIEREYILPPTGAPLLDVAGGNALYACGGLLVWDAGVALLARVGEDYPRQWLKDFERRGINTSGVKILQQSLDVRALHAYTTDFEVARGSPVAQFARRELTFPKALLGYQVPPEAQQDPRKPEFTAPSATDMPGSYGEARAAHLCPLDFVSHHQLVSVLRAGSVTTITVDPSPGYMNPQFLPELRILLSGVTAFIPSEEQIRSLFWGQTYDLWEMIAGVGELGCEIVVVKRGNQGQAVYDVKGKHRWEIPAYPGRPADPTGVGDAFCGGFLAGYKRTYDALQATVLGNVSASLKVEGSGAFYPLGVLPGLAEARLEVLKDLVREV